MSTFGRISVSLLLCALLGLLLWALLGWEVAVLVLIMGVLFANTQLGAVFAIPELRQKVLITLMFLAIYRLGYAIPLPFVNQQEMLRNVQSGSALGNILNFVSMFSGGNLSNATL